MENIKVIIWGLGEMGTGIGKMILTKFGIEIAIATRYGKPIINLEHLQQIHPECEAVDTGDFVDIKGDANLHLAIRPETPGGIGTIAMAVNMIPQVIASRAGLKTMIDLPIPHDIENSFAEQVNYYK